MPIASGRRGMPKISGKHPQSSVSTLRAAAERGCCLSLEAASWGGMGSDGVARLSEAAPDDNFASAFVRFAGERTSFLSLASLADVRIRRPRFFLIRSRSQWLGKSCCNHVVRSRPASVSKPPLKCFKTKTPGFPPVFPGFSSAIG